VKSKVCLVGETGVGKTSLIHRYVLNMFDERYLMTIGTKVSKASVELQEVRPGLDVSVDMTIWDIMGEKGFRQLLKEAYFYGANGILAVCDVSRKGTLEDLDDWIDHVLKVVGEIPVYIVANKVDLREGAKFDDDAIRAFAGPDIRASGVEGPYEAFLSIIPLVWGIDPSTTYVTRAYKATDFDDRADGNRSYWIDSLSASVDPSRVLGVRVVVVRGNDMLTVVYEDTLTIELSDPAGVLVGSVVDRVVLTSGGSSWSMSATFGVLGSGTYTVTAILGPPSAPVDVRSTVVTV